MNERRTLKLGDKIYLFEDDRYIATYKVEATHGTYTCTIVRMDSLVAVKSSYVVLRTVYNGKVTETGNQLNLYQFYFDEEHKRMANLRKGISSTILEAIDGYILSYPNEDSVNRLKEFLKKEINIGNGANKNKGTDSDDDRWD